MAWRHLNHILHRDIGYLCIGLTIIYAISGLLVNHTSHGFNPSYIIEKKTAGVTPIRSGDQPDAGYVARVLEELEEKSVYKNVAMLSPGNLRIFVEGKTIDVNLATGQVAIEKISRRKIFFEMNALHLNKPKGLWTWLADIYAVALLLLALTGMLMIRGRVKWRGILLTATGFLIPLLYLLILS